MTRVTQKRRPAPPPEPKRTRVEQKLETRRKIVAVAESLFRQHGFEATSTKEIARRAGIASGTVFAHAPDKLQLLFLVMHDRLAHRSDRAIATLPHDAPLLDQLLHVFGTLYRMYAETPDIASHFLRAAPVAQGPVGAQVSLLTLSFMARLAGLLGAAQQRGELARDVDVSLLARNLFALYYAGLLAWLGGHTDPETAISHDLRAALALQLRGLVVARSA